MADFSSVKTALRDLMAKNKKKGKDTLIFIPIANGDPMKLNAVETDHIVVEFTIDGTVFNCIVPYASLERVSYVVEQEKEED